MDRSRFDALPRTLATTPSRRHVLLPESLFRRQSEYLRELRPSATPSVSSRSDWLSVLDDACRWRTIL